MKRFGLHSELEAIALSDRRRLHAIAGRAGPHEREDVVQDALVKVVAIEQRTELVKPAHLLARVVRTVAIDRLRRQQRRGTVPLSEIDDSLSDPTADPERGVIGAQRLRRALSVIQNMPARRREVFLLHRVEELTYPQIAAKLGVSVKSVEKHISLALKQLIEYDQ